MIDIHAHILPMIDDGAKNEAESLLMLEAAIKDGIHTIVATPHYHPRYRNEKSDILAAVEKLQEVAEENQLEVDILPGQEIRIYGEFLEGFEADKLLTVAANSTHILIEFSSQSIPHYTEKLFYDIEMCGLTPVIAHPERNAEFLANPDKLYELVRKGALAQLTTGSLLGYFGKEIQKFSKQLIEADLVHFIATDAHNNTSRSFNISQAYEEIVKRYGIGHAAYFTKNAQLMLESKPIYGNQPQPIGKKKFFGIFK